MLKKKLPFKATALYDLEPAELDPTSRIASSSSPSKKTEQNSIGNGNDNGKTDDGLNLFRKSKAMAPILAADREKKLLKKKNKQKMVQQRTIAHARRLSDDDSGECDFEEIIRDVKPSSRRRSEGQEWDDGELGLPNVGESSTSTPVTPPTKRSRLASSQMSRSPKRQRSSQDAPLLSFHNRTPSMQSSQRSPSKPGRSMPPPGTPVISLLSDSEDDIDAPRSSIASQKQKQKQPLRPDTLSPERTRSEGRLDSDDVFGKEETRSEERHRGQAQEDEASQESAVKQAPSDADEDKKEKDKDEQFEDWIRETLQRKEDQAPAAKCTAAKSPDAKQPVSILVRSEIPHTKPLMVKYFYAKSLRVLRDSWIAAQVRHGVQFPDDEGGFVITWCRRIVYPSSSLQTMNIRPLGGGGAGGFATDDDERARGGFTRDGLNVLIELWTEKGYDEMKRLEEEKLRRAAGQVSDDEEGSRSADEDDKQEEMQRRKLKVTLKAQGLEPTNLTVLAETLVRHVVDAFRKQRGIAAERVVELRLDGDPLQDDDTMEDAGVEDMDSLDVYVR